MGITTRKGDLGRTDLLFGLRASKDSLRVEAGGALEELNAFLGLARSELKAARRKSVLKRCQENLFLVGAEVACPPKRRARLKNRLGPEQVSWIEEQIQRLQKQIGKTAQGFVIPGSNRSSALLEVARSVARRAERRIVSLHRRKAIANKHVIVYMNRLSDLLWLLARLEERKTELLRPEG